MKQGSRVLHIYAALRDSLMRCEGTFGKNGPLSGDPDAEQDAGDNFPDSYQQRINIDGYWATTIPADLPSGAYIARHEIISLHYANAPQFVRAS